MKNYEILKTFKGSQHGNDVSVFEEGTVRKLSPDLAKVCVENKMAKETDKEEISADARKRSVKVESITEAKTSEKKVEEPKPASTGTAPVKTPALGNKLLAMATKGK